MISIRIGFGRPLQPSDRHPYLGFGPGFEMSKDAFDKRVSGTERISMMLVPHLVRDL